MCVYKCACVRACVRGWVRACVRGWVRGCVGAWVRGCVGAWVRGCVGACVRACVRACVCVYTQNYEDYIKERKVFRSVLKRLESRCVLSPIGILEESSRGWERKQHDSIINNVNEVTKR